MTMEQGWLFEPQLPFQRSQETSREAAKAAEPAAGTQRAEVLTLLRHYPRSGLTDEQMQSILGMNPSTQRPRRIELVFAGLAVDSGERRSTRSGRRAVVWVAVEGRKE